VHSGYAPKRIPLLEAGVAMHELRPMIEPGGAGKHDSGRGGLTGSGVGSSSSGSGFALHAKAIVVDRQRTLIGSMNLDPRSKLLNTELGVVIDSPALAQAVAAFFADAASPAHAYRVTLVEPSAGSRSPGRKLQWSSGEGASLQTWEHEPETTRGKRLKAELSRMLPIEGLL